MSRPTLYTDEFAAQICERLAEGESLRSICRRDEFPAQSTVFKWLTENSEFSEQYTRAREAQADTLADEILDIADDSSRDTMEVKDETGKVIREQADTEWISRSRLRVDARKWIASKLKPKKYGERISQELTGPGGGPIQHEDTRDRNLSAIETLSARLPGAAPGAATTTAETGDPGADDDGGIA